MTSLGRSSIYKLMEEGTFPISIHLSTRVIAWKRLVIQQWIDSRV
jgi:prophage regulatory protein